MDIKFPKPQYLGAKYIHGEWITRHIPECAQVVLDAFSGSQSISFLCKQLGKKVITNDFLKFNSEIGKALIENKNEILMPEDISILFSDNSDPKEYNLMEQLFTNIFFVREETKFLDAFRSNIDRLKNKYKKALAFTIMNRALTRKVTMGHFAHTQALVYAANPDRIKRNRSLIRPIKDIFSELISEYNNAVFDNGCECISCNEDIIKFLPTLSNIDLAYFDPPYCNSHADYQGFYHLLETYTNYWKDKEFINGIFKKLFSLSKDIPYWLISYNDRSYPDIQTLVDLIRPYRKVSIDRKLYQTGRGGKGSVAGSNEILLVCEP
ncbi:DNA adenine methylase [uncultured Muribaculum sp.]|uniref:DNA adenine methylase n=1 Tax=uncultured Muribaculum sp. TaxID=1918613 RepID=UPI00265D07DD|nr:DNA adenine methylase [uncultured Muribaculum sp.]